MTYLLDISTLVALLVADHVHNEKTFKWAKGKTLAICPLTELGFLRVVISAYNATPEQARATLKDFISVKKPGFIPADISALYGAPFPSCKKSTDWYLANLAQRHGMKWATLDHQANHPATAAI